MRSMRGQTLIAMYMVVLVLTVLGGSFLNRGMTVNRHGAIEQQQTEAFYLAQAGNEDAIDGFINAISTFQISANPPCYPDTNGDGVCAPDVGTQTDVLVTTLCAQSAACPSSPFPAGSNPRAFSWAVAAEAAERTVAEGAGADQLNTYLRNYEIVTQATHPSNAAAIVRLHQVVTRRLVPTFQHAVFYDQDLEMLPGVNMTLSGRVHSNLNMYLDANGSGNTLSIDTEYVRSAGHIYNFRKENGAQYPGDVSIKKAGTSPAEFQLMVPGQDSNWSQWTAESQTKWNGTVKSAVHGVTQLATPAVGSTDPSGSSAYYANNADVKITNGTIQKKDGTLIAECSAAVAATDPNCVPIGTITVTPTGSSDANRFYDNREGKIAKMTNVDLMRLGGYYDGDGNGSLDPPGSSGNPYTSQLPGNGLLYATRSDAASGNFPAIRLTNGSVVNRAGGLTVVSNDPVYVKGDFNTVSKKPVAIVADALNILSNNWQDSTSYQSLSNRIASSTTTINSAFIAGIKTTTSSNYNGGLENYPRMHENWTSKTLYIRGSFVALWNSQIATGNWGYGGSIYTAPIRNWNYDTDFSSTGQLPPFTPWAVEAVRGAWWKE